MEEKRGRGKQQHTRPRQSRLERHSSRFYKKASGKLPASSILMFFFIVSSLEASPFSADPWGPPVSHVVYLLQCCHSTQHSKVHTIFDIGSQFLILTLFNCSTLLRTKREESTSQKEKKQEADIVRAGVDPHPSLFFSNINATSTPQQPNRTGQVTKCATSRAPHWSLRILIRSMWSTRTGSGRC